MAYIPLIKQTKWIDLSDEHKSLRETLEKDTRSACCDGGHEQPIMLQGAFGIGKTTTLFYLFHYAWEVLKVPAFYITLSKIVDRVKENASETDSGKVENSKISKIISEMIEEQIELLQDLNLDEEKDLFFPDYAESSSLGEYLDGFYPVELNIEGEENNEYDAIKQAFNIAVIKAALESGNIPLLLVDEFESKFYELKKYVEASGGGILRDLFDQIVQNCPFYLVIGNGPASGYEIVKEQIDSVSNDSETAANRRLKPLAVPFPTVNLLSKKFLCGKEKGYVNFIWWMSRCRPGHIQKLNDAINYDTLKEYPSASFLTQKIFKQPIDESGEEVTYLKVQHFNSIDSHLLPLFTQLLLNFEPRCINLTKAYKDALRSSTGDFFCSADDKLVNVENDLLPSLSDDVKEILSKEQAKGKFIDVNYIEHINNYFHYILSALTDKEGNIAFSMVGDKNKDEALAKTFLIPLFELSYDFISQYEDDTDEKIKMVKDFLLECIKLIELGLKNDNLEDSFEQTYELFETCKVKEGIDVYLQFSLNTVREIIEQPIGSPVLTYKGRALNNELEEVDFEYAPLIKAEIDNKSIVFIPNLNEEDMNDYLSRCKELIEPIIDKVHRSANKVLRIVYLMDSEDITNFKDNLLLDEDKQLIPIAKLKKIDVRNFDSYQFNFGGQLSDFIDSLCKIALIGSSNGDLDEDDDNSIPIARILEAIDEHSWTPKKEVRRTIEHYEKLLIEGKNAVVPAICSSSNLEFHEYLQDNICSTDDYDDSTEWDLDKLYDDSYHLLSKRLVQLYLIELTNESAEKKHLSEKFLHILEGIGRKTSPIFIKPDENDVWTSIKYADMLSLMQNKNTSSVIDSIDLQSGLIQRIITLCKLMQKDNNISSLSDGIDFIYSDFEDHWFKSYGRELSYYHSNKGDTFIRLLYFLCSVSIIERNDIRESQFEDLTKIAEEISELRGTIREDVTEIKELVYRNDKKGYFTNYLEELGKVSSLITNVKQLLDEEYSKFSILIFVESLICHLENITEEAQNLSKQIKSILSGLKKAKDNIQTHYQAEIDEINKDALAKKLIEIYNSENKKSHPNYENDALWKIFISKVRNDDDFKECLNENYRPTCLKSIDYNALQKALDVIQTKQSTLQNTFSEILTTCQEKKTQADEINNLIEWTKQLIGSDENE